jgi:alkylation response protein AidB-like acyl-CoA dehydrogenase
MDFALNKKQMELIREVQSFAKRHKGDGNILAWQRIQGLPDEVVRDFVNLDFKDYGVIHRNGKTYSIFEQTLVLETVAHEFGATLPFQNDIFALIIMEEFGDYEQFTAVRNEYFKTGRLNFAIAVSEPEAGSDTMNMKMNVQTVDGKLLLNGIKTFVNNGEYAPYLLVAAIDKDTQPNKYPELSFWMMPSKLDGISTYPIPKIGQELLPFSTIEFENVVLDKAYRLQGKRHGFQQLFHLFELGRLFVCATALGLAQAAMDDAMAHAKTREAFGAPIQSFQQIEQMITDMEIKLANMRSYVYRVAWQFDNGVSNRLDTALMKRYVPITATDVASDALQILGGRGYTTLERISAIWQDCRGFQISEGTDQIMVKIAAPLLFKKY